MTRKGQSFSGACVFAWRFTQAQSQTSGWVPVNVQAARAFAFQCVASSAAPLPISMTPSRLGVGSAAPQPHRLLVSIILCCYRCLAHHRLPPPVLH